jgi:hypothetical protein
MPGFCPHEWHQTTEEDLQQMAAGDDYDFWDYFRSVPVRAWRKPSNQQVFEGFEFRYKKD